MSCGNRQEGETIQLTELNFADLRIGQFEAVLTTLLVVGILFFASYNLEVFPRVWFDEGVHLQASKNLVQYGRYGLLNAGEFSLFDPYLTTGPTVLLPMALSFRVFGVGLWQARVVMVVYLLLASLAFFSISHYLYGKRVAILALLLFVGNPLSPVAPFAIGRQVMGEVPALFFFLAGSYLWLRSTEVRECAPWLIGAGIFFGLAMVTKTIYTFWLPLFGVLAILDRLHWRRLSPKHFLLPSIIAACSPIAWYAYQIWALGWDGFLRHVLLLKQCSGNLAGNVSIGLVLLKFSLFKLQLLIVAVMALLYLRRHCDLGEQFFLVLIVLWWTWFLLFSIYWPRYAFPAMIIPHIFFAKLLHDYSGGFDLSKGIFETGSRFRCVGRFTWNLSLTLVAIFFVLGSLQYRARSIFFARDRTPQQFAEYLNTFVDTHALIESWEFEIAFLTNHNYHHPPFPVQTLAVGHVFLEDPYPYDVYDFKKLSPAYAINGPFAKLSGIYEEFLHEECELVTSIGEYDLYRVLQRH